MQVSAYTPPESWAHLIKPQASSTTQGLRSALLAISAQRRKEPATRPIPGLASASGALGPGEYTFSEAITRRTAVCPKFLGAERFPDMNDDPHIPLPRAAHSQTQDHEIHTRYVLPLCDPQLRVGARGRVRTCPDTVNPSIGYREIFQMYTCEGVKVAALAALETKPICQLQR